MDAQNSSVKRSTHNNSDLSKIPINNKRNISEIRKSNASKARACDGVSI